MLRFFGRALLAMLAPTVALAQTDPPPVDPTPPPPPPPVVVAPPPATELAPLVAPMKTTSTGGIPIELTSLRIMRDKNLITQAEYDEAVGSMRDTMGLRADETATVMLAKWSTTLYGFVKSDFITDSTQSFDEVMGNRAVQYPLLYPANNPRVQFSVRDSRFGFKIRAPEWHSVRASAQMEMDFFGTQLPIGQKSSTTPYFQNESATFSSPSVRMRHAFFRVETPVVDFLAGQYWAPLGFQPFYQPNSVQALGFPGILYARVPQLRISKKIETKPVTFEIVAAAVRPAQRDSGTPVGQGGLRIAFNGWKGVQTQGATGTSVMPLSIAVSGDVRHVALTELAANPINHLDLTGGGIALNAFIPVIPASVRKGNSLSLVGELVTGSGLSDQYSDLTGGLTLPENYPNNIDPGIASYDGQTPAQAHLVNWTTWMVGMQYTIPGLDGKLWVSAHYSNVKSDNIEKVGVDPMTGNPITFIGVTATNTVDRKDFFDANVFGDLGTHVRLGIGYSYLEDRYIANMSGVRVSSVNHRVQATGILLF
jgi:hypothetical protein